jgi:serine/threonine protein kinase
MTKYSSSLRRIITKRKADNKRHPDTGYFKMSDIARWCVAVANGLEFLHKNSVIHRDMKPDNVLCTLDVHGDVQSLAITDFDTAKTISKTSQAKTTIGTPSYMCPEVICSGNAHIYTAKADVWSMGMVIYELVTLKEPYEDEDIFEVATLIQSGQRPVIPEAVATEYKPILDIFMSCTQAKPDNRPDIKDVREQLQQLSWA